MDGFLADHHGAREQPGEGIGQVLLGTPVGDGHQVVRAALLVDLVVGELPEPRHDLDRGGLANGFLDIGQVTGQKLFDHVSIRPCRTDNPH